jgi:monothiol glutaredoxin
MNPDTRDRISSLVSSDRIVLFMKGTREQPQCGFSAQVVSILDRLVPEYQTVNVLADPEVRDAIKEYSDWPTIPQLYIGGEFQGGCDIVREMYQAGELHSALGVERVDAGGVEAPDIRVTEAAEEVLVEAQKRYGGGELHLSIDARFRHNFAFGPPDSQALAVDAGTMTVYVDADSAPRARGLIIDAEETPTGKRLRLENPQAPPAIGQMSVRKLAELRESGVPHQLIDVRTEQERASAAISDSRLYDPELEGELQGLPKDSLLVFYCHHGQRSQDAAQLFAALGFKNVHNLAGGIDAWSQQIDPAVPRY